MLHIPRLVLAGLSGGAGKTIVSLGLVRALVQAGLDVAPFKKGPDYIDAAWLGLAAGREASNLDPYLLDPHTLLALFVAKSQDAQLSFTEGNRGLFDGGDAKGGFSTSRLARQLDAPVLLVLDATKMTRTAAAIVHGCATFEPGLNLAGVLLNRTAGERHRRVLRQSIEEHTSVPVLGLLPKLADNPIPERHMGLISNREHAGQDAILNGLAQVMRDNCDLDRVLAVARSAPALAASPARLWPEPEEPGAPSPRIGFVQDAALWFYYQENLEALRRAGAELAPVSLLSRQAWPDLDGLYLGGGFPETQAAGLADNAGVRHFVRQACAAGMPVYAECGGFMYLCEELHVDEAIYPMAGVFPLATTLCARPQGLGYAKATVVAENPFHPLGVALLGHEFHYSRCLARSSYTGHGDKPAFALAMQRGSGMLGGQDGIITRNTFAAYTHIHALSAPHWAPNFVRAARRYAASRRG